MMLVKSQELWPDEQFIDSMTPQFRNFSGTDVSGGPIYTVMKAVYSIGLAEGTTRTGFDEYICMQNPHAEDVPVKIEYMLGDGKVVEQEISVGARSRKTVKVSDVIDAEQDVSARVESKNRSIVVERPIYFNYQGEWRGGHNSSGADTPSNNHYFAEGTTRKDFDTYLCLQNPRDGDTEAVITYMLGNGENMSRKVAVPAKSRITVRPVETVGENKDFSTFIHSYEPIFVERPMYFSYQGSVDDGHISAGVTRPANVFYFPEGTTRVGFDMYLCLQNPCDNDAEVTVTYMLDGGENIEETISISPKSRFTVKPVDTIGTGKDMSIEVSSGTAVVAERSLYFNYEGSIKGGHVSAGAAMPPYPSKTLLFAEGTTREGFDEYICIQNPSAKDASVSITYMMDDGENKVETLMVPKRSRATVIPSSTVGYGKDVSARIESDIPIVAERPMYFTYQGEWSGGHTCLALPQ
jgi:hypothetical protein